MTRETEYEKFEKELREFGDSYKKAVEERDAALKMIKQLADALDAPEWQHVWTLLNAFASGKTQNQFARVEPIAVLGDTYQGCAMIYERGRKALKELNESGLLPEEKADEAEVH